MKSAVAGLLLVSSAALLGGCAAYPDASGYYGGGYPAGAYDDPGYGYGGGYYGGPAVVQPGVVVGGGYYSGPGGYYGPGPRRYWDDGPGWRRPPPSGGWNNRPPNGDHGLSLIHI